MENVRIAITGAAGQIGYSLLPRIAAGEMFGSKTKLEFINTLMQFKKTVKSGMS